MIINEKVLYGFQDGEYVPDWNHMKLFKHKNKLRGMELNPFY